MAAVYCLFLWAIKSPFLLQLHSLVGIAVALAFVSIVYPFSVILVLLPVLTHHVSLWERRHSSPQSLEKCPATASCILTLFHLTDDSA